LAEAGVEGLDETGVLAGVLAGVGADEPEGEATELDLDLGPSSVTQNLWGLELGFNWIKFGDLVAPPNHSVDVRAGTVEGVGG